MNDKEWDAFVRNHTEEEINAEAAKIKCTMCGKPFDEWDIYLGNNRYDLFVGFGSRHDEERIQFDFCSDCFDRVLDMLIPMCKINPIVDDDYMTHCLRKTDGVICFGEYIDPRGPEHQKKKRRVYIDMDGVLTEYRPFVKVEDMERAGFFRSLRPVPVIIDAVKTLIRTQGTEVFVLSAVLPWCKEQSEQEKNDWLDEHLPEVDAGHRLFSLCGENKADSVKDISRNDILLDDHSPNLEAWVKAGGTAIKVLNEINGRKGTFVSGPRIRIKKSEDLLSALENI